MTREQERNARQRCARTVCEADIGDTSDGSFVHRHSGYRYCRRCAVAINAACPEAPPFDVDGLEAKYPACPECRAPWRLHWQYAGPPGDRRALYNTCGLSRGQIAAKWLGDSTEPLA